MKRMGAFAVVLVFFTFNAAGNTAGAAGIQKISFINTPGGGADGVKLEGAVWHPCLKPPGGVLFRGVQIQAARDCPVEGRELPLIVFSHGAYGWFGGHHDTAAALADAGFIVAAVTHPNESSRTWRTRRPAAVKALTDYMLSRWPGRKHLDAGRVGFFGFSRGAYTGLVLAGGVPNFRRLLWRCLLSLWSDPMCARPQGADKKEDKNGADEDGGGSAVKFTADPRIKAAVIAAPVGVVFSDEGLAEVNIPIQLWRAEKDELLLYPRHAEAVYKSLPVKPEYHVIEGAGHFAFMPPCGAVQVAAAPMICADHSGFNRAAFHEIFNTQVIEFFRRRLARP